MKEFILFLSLLLIAVSSLFALIINILPESGNIGIERWN
jgi:hypothetical protein